MSFYPFLISSQLWDIIVQVWRWQSVRSCQVYPFDPIQPINVREEVKRSLLIRTKQGYKDYIYGFGSALNLSAVSTSLTPILMELESHYSNIQFPPINSTN